MKRPDKEEMKPQSTKEPLECAIWYSRYAGELEKYADYLEGLVKNSRLGDVSDCRSGAIAEENCEHEFFQTFFVNADTEPFELDVFQTFFVNADTEPFELDEDRKCVSCGRVDNEI